MRQSQTPKRRTTWLPQIIFLILTFVTAVSGTYVALRLFGDDAEEQPVPEIITVEIIITATPAPTPLPDLESDARRASAVDLPSNLAAAAPGATIDAGSIGAVDVAIGAPTIAAPGAALSDNCVFHTVVAGDTPYGIAQKYGADRKLLLEVNDLTLESIIQIGDVLRVPLEGCAIEGVARGSVSPPTATPLPAEVDIAISSAEGIGDITAEAITLHNAGAQVNISGWTLRDADGKSYTFPATLLLAEGDLVIFSRNGTSTDGAHFWGSDESIWSVGESATLTDAAGNLRKRLQIPGGGT